MPPANLTLSGKRFVVIPEREYLDLKQKAQRKGPTSTRSATKKRRTTSQESGDIAESRRRLADRCRVPADALLGQLGV